MEQLYKENVKIVYHYLWSLCHDKSLTEDLTQETFLRAYQSLERYDKSCKLSTWLCQIAKHLYYQWLAKNKREIPAEPTPGPCPKPQPEDACLLEGLFLAGILLLYHKLFHPFRKG